MWSLWYPLGPGLKVDAFILAIRHDEDKYAITVPLHRLFVQNWNER